MSQIKLKMPGNVSKAWQEDFEAEQAVEDIAQLAGELQIDHVTKITDEEQAEVIKEFFAPYEDEDAKRAAMVEDGTLKKSEYRAWRESICKTFTFSFMVDLLTEMKVRTDIECLKGIRSTGKSCYKIRYIFETLTQQQKLRLGLETLEEGE